MTGQESEMREELSETFERFLSQFENNKKVSEIDLNDSIEEKLLALTELCAMGRTGVSRDRYTRAVEYLPLPEGPARLIKQFRTLASGIAIINRKTEIDGDVYGVIKRIGENTIPGPRNLVLKTLKRLGITYEDDQWLKTREISESTNVPSPTARLLLEDMMMLNLLNRRFFQGVQGEDPKENTPYQWQIRQEAYELMEQSEIYEFDENFEDIPF